MLTSLGVGDDGSVVADVLPHEGERLAGVTLSELMETEGEGVEGTAPVEGAFHVTFDPCDHAAGKFREKALRNQVPKLSPSRRSRSRTQHAASVIHGTCHDADACGPKATTNFRENLPLGRARLRRDTENDEGRPEPPKRATDACDQALHPCASSSGVVQIEDTEAPRGEAPTIQNGVAGVIEIKNEDEKAGRISG
ncbi:MAG: hypothetical protein Q8S73_20655 [Deltaproteobacteria bacterium]|nr:hypothetical protein [Deltaproteobacteria bacterium]